MIPASDRKAFIYWFSATELIFLVTGGVGLLNVLVILLTKNLVFAKLAKGSEVVLPLDKEGNLLVDCIRRTWCDLSKRWLGNWLYLGGLLTGLTYAFVLPSFSGLFFRVLVGVAADGAAFLCIYKWLTTPLTEERKASRTKQADSGR